MLADGSSWQAPNADNTILLCSAISLPDNEYPLWDSLGEEIVASGKLSQLQLEGVRYACDKHLEILPSGQRAGFFIGDGAGVGKGRQISGAQPLLLLLSLQPGHESVRYHLLHALAIARQRGFRIVRCLIPSMSGACRHHPGQLVPRQNEAHLALDVDGPAC